MRRRITRVPLAAAAIGVAYMAWWVAGQWTWIAAKLTRPILFPSEHGEVIQAWPPFSKSRSWIRHDEHDHVTLVIDEGPRL